MNKFLFLDLETTGTNPLTDKILEVACVVTDSKLKEIESYSSVPRHLISSLSMDSWCLETHTKSGLLEEVAKSVVTLDDIELELTKIIRRHFPVTRPALSGNSINFDKRFLEVHMHSVFKRMHYRVIDVSSFMLANSIYHNFTLPKSKATAHRALEDCRDSVLYLKQYLDKFNK